MAWKFEPADDLCLGCGRKIDFRQEPHYIVYNARADQYRRQCTACYEKAATVHDHGVITISREEKEKENGGR